MYLKLMKQYHIYEYRLHKNREILLLVSLVISYLIIDLNMLVNIAYDFENLYVARFC